MLIKKLPLYLAASLCITTRLIAADAYENFSMTKNPAKVNLPDTSSFNYNSNRVQIKGLSVRTKKPSVNQEEFMFAREAFLAEKRDESIRLLRQQLDSGMKANLDNTLLKLGQLYAEKYMELSYLENEAYSIALADYEADRAKDPSVKRPPLDNTRSKRYLQDATAIFYDMEKKFPKHPKIDEVFFFIGFVEMENGKEEKGIRYLQRVVNHKPTSRKHGEAVVNLGDYYFEKAKFKESAKYYRLLAENKESYLHDYVNYKLAWCTLNLGEPRKALKDMKEIIANLNGVSDKASFNLREQALKDLVIFYGEADDVDDAMDYFTEVQGKEKAMENLKLIADIMRSKARDSGAIHAYEKLLENYGKSIDAPRLTVGLYEALSRKGQTERSVQVLLEGLERYGEDSRWGSNFPTGKNSEVQENRELLREEAEKAAYFFHHSAQKSSARASYDYALRLYSGIIDHFPSAKSRKKLAFYKGEIYFTLGKWFEASDAYMICAKEEPKDKMSDEAAYNAVLALDRLTAKENQLERYSKEKQKTLVVEEKTIPKNEQRFIDVAKYYLKEYPKGDKVAEVRFRIGAIYYQYHHLTKALDIFNELAKTYPTHKSATTAAHIVLDIHNIKKDYDSLGESARAFLKIKDLGDAKFKAEVASITAEINFKSIESFEDNKEWVKAGSSYLSFYEKDPKSPLAEKALYNAHVSFEKADALDFMERTARLFVNNFPKSDYAPKLLISLAKLSERRYDLADAQKHYLELYKKFPKDKEAPKALYNAALFAELNDHPKEALELYADYVAKGYAKGEEKLAIQISQAKNYRKTGDWTKFTAIYRQLAKESKTVQDKLTYLGELARQYEKAGKTKEKIALLGDVRAMHLSSEKAKELSGQAALIYAEAIFKDIDKTREKYYGVQLKFPPEVLLAAMKKREFYLTQLMTEYDKVISIGVPEWGVAALYEKSEAYANFVKSFRSVKVPSSYTGEVKTEAETALKGIDEKLVKPLEAKATEFAQLCTTRSTEFFVVSEYADKCRRNDPNAVDTEMLGILPKPAYWSTRWRGEG